MFRSPTPAAAAPDELNILLDGAGRYAPECRNGLSSHLPMALTARQRLGASEPRLVEFGARYSRRLEPAPDCVPTPTEDWRTLRGRVDAFPTLLAHFERQIAEAPAGQVLRQAVPALLPGSGAGAFLGLLRTAYAWDAQHRGEFARGLAYWACRWLPLTGVLPRRGGDGLTDWLQRLSAWQASPPQPPELIFERMTRIATAPGFSERVDGLRSDETTPGELADAAACRYLETRDFTVPHLITSVHALHVLRPFVGDEDEAWRWYALGYPAGRVAGGTASVRDSVPAELDWPEMAVQAATSDDDHVVKIVSTCREMAGLRDGGLYRDVARLALSR